MQFSEVPMQFTAPREQYTQNQLQYFSQLSTYPPLYVPNMRPNYIIKNPSPEYQLNDIRVELHNMELWKQFNVYNTEMIITKNGRRMFPTIHIGIKGLNENTNYCIGVEMVLKSTQRLKFNNRDKDNNVRGWIHSGPAEVQAPLHKRFFWHTDGPATGHHWQKQPVNFIKLKLTNNIQDKSYCNMILNSMHKYTPKIWIIESDHLIDCESIPFFRSASFVFEDTDFIAVTAYQNDNITRLKIDNNPFAKGFRDTGLSSKRKRDLAKRNDTTDLSNINNTFDIIEEEENSLKDDDEKEAITSELNTSNLSTPKILSVRACTPYNPLTPDSSDTEKQKEVENQNAYEVDNQKKTEEINEIEKVVKEKKAQDEEKILDLSDKSTKPCPPLKIYRPWKDGVAERSFRPPINFNSIPPPSTAVSSIPLALYYKNPLFGNVEPIISSNTIIPYNVAHYPPCNQIVYSPVCINNCACCNNHTYDGQ